MVFIKIYPGQFTKSPYNLHFTNLAKNICVYAYEKVSIICAYPNTLLNKITSGFFNIFLMNIQRDFESIFGFSYWLFLYKKTYQIINVWIFIEYIHMNTYWPLSSWKLMKESLIYNTISYYLLNTEGTCPVLFCW